MAELLETINNTKLELEQLGLQTPDIDEKLKTLKQFSCQQSHPPIQEFVDSGILPIIIQLTNNSELSEKSRLNILWLLTNIASGTSEICNYIFTHGCVDVFIQHLYHASSETVEQAVWGLGNIAGDCAQLRDKLLIQYEITDKILNSYKSLTNKTISIKKNFLWTISNLCRGKPAPKKQYILPFLSFFISFIEDDIQQLNSIQIDETLVDLLWGFCYCTNEVEDCEEILLQKKNVVFPFLKKCLKYTQLSIVTPTLRILGNCSTGTDVLTDQILINNCVIDIIQVYYNQASPKAALKKEIMWLFSNIGAGTDQQIKILLKDENFINLVIFSFENDGSNFSVINEVDWAVSNIIKSGSEDSVQILIQSGIIQKQINSFQHFIQSHNDTSQLKKLATVFFEGMNFLLERESIQSVQDLKTNEIRKMIKQSILLYIQRRKKNPELPKDIFQQVKKLVDLQCQGIEDQMEQLNLQDPQENQEYNQENSSDDYEDEDEDYDIKEEDQQQFELENHGSAAPPQ